MNSIKHFLKKDYESFSIKLKYSLRLDVTYNKFRLILYKGSYKIVHPTVDHLYMGPIPSTYIQYLDYWTAW